MALSNWDVLAFDSEGQPCKGHVEGFLEGTACEIYKSFLYVRSAKGWQEGQFAAPYVAEIVHGDVLVAGFQIKATRGPQEAIFVYVEAVQYHDQVKGAPYNPPSIRRMAGIGCYGFTEFDYQAARDVLGLGPEYKEWSTETSIGGDEPQSFGVCFVVETGEEYVTHRFDLSREAYTSFESKWVGCLPDTLAQFMAWLKDLDDSEGYKEWLAKVERAQPLRMNQGDLFFHEMAGVALASTSPGAAGQPVIEKVWETLGEQGLFQTKEG